MAYRNSQQGNLRLSCGWALFVFSIMLTAAASNALTRHNSPPAAAITSRTSDVQERHWTLDEVRDLIAAIERSEKRGYDSSSYGLAALRSELDQSVLLWGRSGSRQLDILARTSALALANDVRKRTGADAVSREELNAALDMGQLPSWLMHEQGARGAH